MSLESLGISKEMLTFLLIYIGFILILLFAFIFLGIKAFALGGGFGAIINSIMALSK
jgi:hypothetical protein